MEGHTDKQTKQMGPMKDLQGYLTQEQVVKLFNACETNRERLLIRLLWKTGRRVGELIRLKVKDIDFDEANIRWHIEKKNIYRKRNRETPEEFEVRRGEPKPDYLVIKPIDSNSLNMLRDYILKEGLTGEDYVFYSAWKERQPITRFRIFQIIRRIGERAGITQIGGKGLHPHHFRHGFSIFVLKHAKDPRAIALLQRTLEHSNIQTTMHYLQFSQEDLREILEESD